MLFSAINLGEELWIALDCAIIGTHTWVGDIGGLVSGGNVIQLSHLRLAKKKKVRAHLDTLIETIKTSEYIHHQNFRIQIQKSFQINRNLVSRRGYQLNSILSSLKTF